MARRWAIIIIYILVIYSLIILVMFPSPPGHTSESIQTNTSLTPKSPRHILLIHESDYGLPWYTAFTEALRDSLDKISNIKIELHVEFTGLSYHFDDDYVQLLVALYGRRYADHRIDLIITTSNVTTRFITEHGKVIFPSTPILFITDTEDVDIVRTKQNMTGIVEKVEIEDTLNLALELLPKTRHIAVVSGASDPDRFYEAKARRVIKKYEGKLEPIYLTGLSWEELLDNLRRLPAYTVVLYLPTLQDAEGTRLVPMDVLPAIVEAANRPVFSFWDTLLGTGIVGGVLFSTEIAGEKSAEMALSILNGKAPRSIPIVRGASEYMFDARQLEKWGIREGSLPHGAIIRYKTLTFWDLYKWHVIFYSLFLVLGAVGYVQYKGHQYKKRLEQEGRMRKLLEQTVEARTAELQKANTELERLSNTDGLTSVYNRRHFEALLQTEWSRHMRNKAPFSLVMCDVDFFKRFNDTYGHQAGDACLKKVAQALKEAAGRSHDITARYGGEEFVILLPETDSEAATVVAERARIAVQQLEIPHSTSLVKSTVSISMGVATVIPDQSNDSTTIVNYADRMLYESKKNGRDRIHVFNHMSCVSVQTG